MTAKEKDGVKREVRGLKKPDGAEIQFGGLTLGYFMFRTSKTRLMNKILAVFCSWRYKL